MELVLIVVVSMMVVLLGFAAWMVFQVQEANKQRDQTREEAAALLKKVTSLQAALDETNRVLVVERTTHGEQVVRLTDVASARAAELVRLEAEHARDPAGGGDRLRRVLSEGGSPPGPAAPSPANGPWGGGVPGRPSAKP